jgi:hypothetical protein
LAWLLDRRVSLTPPELEFVHGTLADTLREVLRTCGGRILERALEDGIWWLSIEVGIGDGIGVYRGIGASNAHPESLSDCRYCRIL